MPPLLLGEALAQRLHQLLPAAERFDLPLLLLGQRLLDELPEPLLGNAVPLVRRRLEPLAVEAGSPFDTYKYRLEIIGHYDQLGEFLSDIASLNRIIVPQDVVLKPAQQQAQHFLADTLGALLEAQFAIRTFVKAAAPPPD